ncbi:MAG: hypothetical protein BGP06_14335 [Rhizobiales bacterium 65-9]|nr:MAG: hypothetical protein BGP06_14335 [Rhizobiales bacterium 65-9]
MRASLMAGAAMAAILPFSGTAIAGGFFNMQQSTVFNGTAYAGFAAPGSMSISGMYINPALMTQFGGFTTENNFLVVQPTIRIRGVSGVIPPAFGGTLPSGDIAQDALSPASYGVLPLGAGFYAGLAINAPYGNTTKPAMPWGGQLNSMTTKIRTYTFTPSLAYAVSPQLSVGVGVQIQYFKTSLESAAGLGPDPGTIGLKGDGWGYGVTAGVSWLPVEGTAIGLGYRSRIDQDLDGSIIGTPLPNPLRGISTTVRLPDRLNLSVRQRISPDFDLLGSVEWYNWSRIGTSIISGPGLALLPPAVRAGLSSLPLEYKDGWMFSLGGEYRWNQALTLRAGAAYEISPIDTAVRTTRLPDADRLWLSAGLSYEFSERLSFNASYSRVLVKNADLNVQPPFGQPYVGQAKSHSDIFAIGFTTRWTGAAPADLPRAVVRKG